MMDDDLEEAGEEREPVPPVGTLETRYWANSQSIGFEISYEEEYELSWPVAAALGCLLIAFFGLYFWKGQ